MTIEAEVSRNSERGNLNVHFPSLDSTLEVVESPIWQMGVRSIQFVQLSAETVFNLAENGLHYVKVVTGSLREPARGAFCEPRGLQDTRIQQNQVRAGASGAVLAIFGIPEGIADPVTSMQQLQFQGPLSEELRWRTFEEQFGEFLDAFNGADAYIGPGFHLLDDGGDEITYLNLWTAGKGVDLTTHNHGQAPSDLAPAFAEIHLTICNGTGTGGMYECDEPGASERSRLPVPAGYEHGPYFNFDSEGKPLHTDTGAVAYPWHGWQAGTDNNPGQSYDVVAAFETAPHYARVNAL